MRYLNVFLLACLVVGSVAQLNEIVECPFIPNQPYSLLQSIREAQHYDRYVINANYLPFKPPFDPPCPGAPFEDQYVPTGDIDQGQGFVLYTANIIPWRVNQTAPNFGVAPGLGLFPNLTPVSDKAYRKLAGIAFSLARPAGLDFNTIAPDSDRLTVFAKDFEFRGPDNLIHRQYQFALRPSLFELYEPKVQDMWDDIRTEIEPGTVPVLSTTQRKLVKMFLDIHVGSVAHPQFVFDYFLHFLPLAGLVRNRQVDLTKLILDLETDQQGVYNYFEQRVIAIQNSGDNTTFVFHWDVAGLPLPSLVTECLHNIVAFAQFANTMFLAITDKVWAEDPPVGVPPYYLPNSPIPFQALNIGPIPVNFFAKYDAAADGVERLNVIREMFRLLAPNSAAFSRVEFANNLPPAPEDMDVQSRHVWVFLSSLTRPFTSPDPVSANRQRLSAYYLYDTSQYAGYDTSLTGYTTGPVPDPSVLTPNDAFFFNAFDNGAVYNDGTVCFNEDPKLIPVFPDNRFLVFGMNYRACPGIGFSFFVADRMLATFKDLDWEFRVPDPDVPCNPVDPDITRHVAVAPRGLPLDNLYVKVAP